MEFDKKELKIYPLLKKNIMKKIIKIALILPISVNAQVKSLVFKGEKRKYIIYVPKTYSESLVSDKKQPI